MTEEDARAWMVDWFGQEISGRVALFVDMVVAENSVQNLVSPASIPAIWVRHVVDSAQLINLAPKTATRWVDIGTGGGFPGMIIGICWTGAVTMVEPRKLRAAFLQTCVGRLGLTQASVAVCKIEAVGQDCCP